MNHQINATAAILLRPCSLAIVHFPKIRRENKALCEVLERIETHHGLQKRRRRWLRGALTACGIHFR
jgi:hypothetical protein